MLVLGMLVFVFSWSFSQAKSLCSVTSHMLYVEKDERRYCIAISTTICAGYCMTRARTNVKILLSKTPLAQSAYMHNDVNYVSIKILGCPSNVYPFYRFAVALSCRCYQCN
ncbi:TSHB protein, partial [Polyodon spathula]|nr:TSHB protein [Polyodon spathula]